MFDPVEKVIEAVRAGGMVVVTDDEKRENEGDLVMAAEKVSDHSVNFMTKEGRGLICASLTSERLKKLGLTTMVRKGKAARFHTAFMESVDAAEGISTGISAHDRARTIRVLVDENSVPDDLVTPGHTFPLEAKAGGVLRRAGHTEAAVDLARLAGLNPAGVICEILSEDGRMARLEELRGFARGHGLLMTSVADLIAYRMRNEKLVTVIRRVDLPTRHGKFSLHLFDSEVDQAQHVALVMGEISEEDPALVRVHSECLTGDVFGAQRCDCGHQLDLAMEMVAREGRGVVLYMRQEGRGIGLANKIHAYALQDEGLDTVEANERLGFQADLRDYGVGAQILRELGLRKIRLITNNPRKVIGLDGYGLEIQERIPLIVEPTEHSRRYLQTKRDKLGHLI